MLATPLKASISLLQSVKPWKPSPAPHLRTVVLHRWILLFGVLSIFRAGWGSQRLSGKRFFSPEGAPVSSPGASPGNRQATHKRCPEPRRGARNPGQYRTTAAPSGL